MKKLDRNIPTTLYSLFEKIAKEYNVSIEEIIKKASLVEPSETVK